MNNFNELISEYFNFLKEIVDSIDLSLKIFRKQLQKNRIIELIRKNIIKKTLELFNSILEKKEIFKTFYEYFSKNIKLYFHKILFLIFSKSIKLFLMNETQRLKSN
jgi:molecular chaperone HtpG